MGKVHTILLEMKHCKTSQLMTSQTPRAKQPNLRTRPTLTGIPCTGFRTLGLHFSSPLQLPQLCDSLCHLIKV